MDANIVICSPQASRHRSEPNKSFAVLQGTTVSKATYSNSQKQPIPILKNIDIVIKQRYQETDLSKICPSTIKPIPAIRTLWLYPPIHT